MFENIKKRYIDYCIKTIKTNSTRKKHFFNMKNIEKIGILYSVNESNRSFIQEINKLIGNEKKVSVWCFSEDQTDLKDSVFLHLINSNDISFFQKPNNQIVDKYKSENYDVLIDLTLKENLTLKYLLGISQSPCICGLHKDDYNLYDFEINTDNPITEKELLKQILYYLNTIQAKL